MSENRYKYLAFISYKREDVKWAKWLQHKLESYKLPTALRKKDPSLPEHIRPVFRDTTDLTGGNLEKSIKKSLQCSKYLIVICSPRAAQSPWVCKEVQDFIDSGREEYIIPFIIDGEPNSKDIALECFPRNLRELSGSRELLGININEMGRDAAAIKVVARMFGLQFDTLWQRWEREKKRKRRLTVVLSLLVVVITLIIAGVLFYQYRKIQINLARLVSQKATQLVEEGDSYLARRLLLEVLPDGNKFWDFPYIGETERAFRLANKNDNRIIRTLSKHDDIWVNSNGDTIISVSSMDKNISIFNTKIGKSTKKNKLTTDNFIHHKFISPTGKYLFAKDIFKNSIDIVDIGTGEIITQLNGCISSDNSSYYSPNDELVYFIDSTICVYDINTRKSIQFEKKHTNDIKSAFFSANGKYVVSSSKDKTIRLWNVNTGKCINTWKTSIGEESCLDISSNGRYLMGVFNANTIKFWDRYDDRCDSIYHNEMIEFAYLHSSGNKIVYGVKDTIYVYHLSSKKTKILPSYGKNIYDVVCFNIDREEYIISKSEEELCLWNINTLECIKVHKLYSGTRANNFSITIDGKYAIYTLNNGMIGIWDIKVDNSELTLPCRIISSSYAYGVSKGGNSSIYIWNLRNGKCIDTLEHHNVSAITISNNDRYLVSASRNLFVWDLKNMNRECLKGQHYGLIASVFCSPEGDYIMSRFEDGYIEIWNRKTGICINTFSVDISQHDELYGFTPDGKYILIHKFHENSLCLLDLYNGNPVRKFQYPEYTLMDVDPIFSHDGKYIISAFDDNTIRMWKIDNGLCVDTIIVNSYGEYIDALCAGPQNNAVLFVLSDGTINVWNIDSSKVKTIRRQGGSISSICYSLDEKYIAYAMNNSIYVWDVKNEKNLDSYKDLNRFYDISEIYFSPDARRIFSVCYPNLKIWKFDPLQDMIKCEKERFKDNPLTDTERKEYGLE